MSRPPAPTPLLVDTSVWVDHLRSANPRLASHLEHGQVWCHPFVLGELACGSLSNRSEILEHLAALPAAKLAEHHEVLAFIEAHRLAGRGICWVDAHLLASARLSHLQLWTLDRQLEAIASELGLHPPS